MYKYILKSGLTVITAINPLTITNINILANIASVTKIS